MRYPHCDPRILHKPGECEYCDKSPEWQELRKAWGIAFTGHDPARWLPECGEAFRDYGDERRICRLAAQHDGGHNSGQEWEFMPCPADTDRPPGADNDHRRWPGNTTRGY